MAQVVLDNIRKVYKGDTGDVVAVKDFDLEIRDREFIVLVGPSGCGKTTTLRMIAGLEEITEGTIAIGDRVAVGRAVVRRPAAFLFDEPLGDEQIVHLELEVESSRPLKLVAKLDSHVEVKVNQRFEAHLNMEKVHVFDNETEQNLSLESGHVASRR